MVEIQGSTSSVAELPVEGLACDFLGARVVFSLLCVIWTAIAPPRELAGTLLAALLDNSTDGIWEPLMTDPIHNDIGDGFSIVIIFALGLPVDGAGRQVIASSRGSFPVGSTACTSGLLMISA